MPNTRSKSRNLCGAKSKYMRSSTVDDDGEELVESPINALSYFGNPTGLAQQEVEGMYKVEMYKYIVYNCSFVQLASFTSVRLHSLQ